jgi:hypothetical protein
MQEVLAKDGTAEIANNIDFYIDFISKSAPSELLSEGGDRELLESLDNSGEPGFQTGKVVFPWKVYLSSA